jgi:hypothetical protein
LIDGFELVVPADRIPGETYEAIVGFYNWRTLERLQTVDMAGQPVGDHVEHLLLEQYVFHPF